MALDPPGASPWGLEGRHGGLDRVQHIWCCNGQLASGNAYSLPVIAPALLTYRHLT